MDLSAKNDVFMLSVNMMSYIKLPYKYNIISEDDENIEFDATIALNQINISIPQPWSNLGFVKNF